MGGKGDFRVGEEGRGERRGYIRGGMRDARAGEGTQREGTRRKGEKERGEDGREGEGRRGT